ncbi:MAG: CinA family protein [Alphaproteobacteria bacterium]|nr:CinA family protein [Alphaproteobacteria bacterium]
MFDNETLSLAEAVLAACRGRGWRVATAESCTGGLVAAALTAISGASEVFERAFVTYSNEAKIEMVAVPSDTIASHGAVSAQTAAAMARGAVRRAPADVALSVTGVAGPRGATQQKPIGLVYLGVARRDGACRVERRIFPGDRAEIRQAAVVEALQMLRDETRAT